MIAGRRNDPFTSFRSIARSGRVNGEERELDIYSDEGFRVLSNLWTRSGWQAKYSYELTWLGIPVIQMPEDVLMMQEVIWKVRPDVVVECGVAHGGALVLYASVLELLGKGHVVGVDVEIRKYNRLAIESHPLSHRISLIEGDSVADDTFAAVRSHIRPGDTSAGRARLAPHPGARRGRARALCPARHARQLHRRLRRRDVDASPTHRTQGRTGRTTTRSWRCREFLRRERGLRGRPSYGRLGVTYCPEGFLRRRSETRGLAARPAAPVLEPRPRSLEQAQLAEDAYRARPSPRTASRPGASADMPASGARSIGPAR